MSRLHLLLIFVALLTGAPARADLLDYVRKPEAAFAWRVLDTQRSDIGTSYRLELVSQTWRGAPWRHDLEVHVPTKAEGRTALLFLSGGSATTWRSRVQSARW